MPVLGVITKQGPRPACRESNEMSDLMGSRHEALVRAVVFDVGGVLLTLGEWEYRREIARRMGLDDLPVEYEKSVPLLQRGEMAEEELWFRIAGKPVAGNAFDDAWLAHFPPVPEMLALGGAAQAGGPNRYPLQYADIARAADAQNGVFGGIRAGSVLVRDRLPETRGGGISVGAGATGASGGGRGVRGRRSRVRKGRLGAGHPCDTSSRRLGGDPTGSGGFCQGNEVGRLAWLAVLVFQEMLRVERRLKKV